MTTGPDHRLVLSFTPGTDRNDFNGEVGIRIVIGSADITVSWLGYLCNTGNTGLRTINLYEWATNTVVATATVDLTGATAGDYVWGSISPFTLLAGGQYAVMALVTAWDGQMWPDFGPITMQPSIALVSGAFTYYGLNPTDLDVGYIGLDLGWDDPPAFGFTSMFAFWMGGAGAGLYTVPPVSAAPHYTKLGPGGYSIPDTSAPPLPPIIRVLDETVRALEVGFSSAAFIRVFNETVRIAEAKLASISVEIIKNIAETVRVNEVRLGLAFAEITRTINEFVRSYDTISAGPPPTSPSSSLFISSVPADDRNDFTGEVGVRLGIGPANIPVSWMGYRCHTGNTGLRTINLYEWFSGSVVATATVDLTGKTAGQWVWVAIPSYTLLAGGYYALVAGVTASDGQMWLNNHPVTMQSSITNVYATYKPPAGAFGVTGIDLTFIGLDLGSGGVSGAGGGGSIIRAMILNRMVNETERLVEALFGVRALTRMVADPVTVHESGAGGRARNQMVGETVRLIEVPTHTLVLTHWLNETVRLVETSLVSRVMARLVSEFERVNETLVNTSIISRVVSELVRISEDVLSSLTMTRVRDEFVRVADGVAIVTMKLTRLLDESVRVGEAVLTATTLSRVVDELVRIGENLLPTLALTRVRNEIVRLIEEPIFLRPLIRVLDEAVRVTETLFSTLGLSRSIGETLTVKEKTEFSTGQVWMANEKVVISEVRIPTRRILRLRGEYVRSLETRQPMRALLRVVSDLLHLPELTNAIATIPTLVCSVIKLYAMYAGDAMLAPLVMGSVLVNPEVGGGSASVYVAVDGSPEMEPLVDGQPQTKPLVEAEVKIEECCQ